VKAEREEGVAGAIAEAVAEATAAGERQSDPARQLGAVLAIAVQVLPGQEHAGPVALGLAAVALDGAQVLLSTAIAVEPVPDTQHTLIAAPEPPVGSRQVTPELGAPSAAGACGALVSAIAEPGRRQRLPGEGCVIIVGYRLWDHGLLALHKTAQRQGGRCPRLPEVAWVDIAPYVPVTARGERPSLLDACGRFGLTFSDDAGTVAEAIGGLTLCLRMFGYMPPLCEAAESQRELSLRLFRAEQIALC
jgi:hypothetical protein